MSTPPRRRRPDAHRSWLDGGWLPTIALGLGVVVAGLGIGKLVGVFMQRSTESPAPVASVTSPPAPVHAATRPPLAIATIEPPRTPRPSPSPSTVPTAETQPSQEPAATPAAPSPTAPPAAVRVPVAAATTAQVAAATPAPAAGPSQSPAGAAEPTAAAVVSAAPSAAPAITVSAPPVSPAAPPQTTSAYDEHASAVVRRYLGALIRGDEKTAYAALGGSGGTLSEQSFLDPNARIVSLKVTRIDASNASVACEIATAKGHYYATYHVTAGTNGPYISQHDYIRV